MTANFSVPDSSIDQLILVIIDNFGLYEIITYQPGFMIKALENLLLITPPSKDRALADPMIQDIFYSQQNKTFNLIDHVLKHDKQIKVITREDDLSNITTNHSVAITEKSDINIYVKAVKAINRYDFLVLHFSDFDEMYKRYSMSPPDEVAAKVMRRTDKWLNLFNQQAIDNTALMVIGNKGKRPIDMHLEGRAAEWKRANLPIGLIKFP
ncbi:MAG: hypothetical protein EU542_06430 [Promethearchaeota archaeon]|nr:MAG: hypothetical protein EU542_06430 [Candidatus Lokiarchaeota archaeon]